MNDLEELLRTDLARAAEPIDSGLDADDLLATGHRARRSRTTRVGAGLTAVLVTAAGLGLVVAANVYSGGRAPILATPSPSSSTSRPSTSASAQPTMSVAPGTTGQVTFDSDSITAATSAQSVTVSATRLADGGYSVEFGMARRYQQNDQQHATNDGHSISWIQLTPKVLVGFVPHTLDWIQYLDNDEAGPFGAFSSDLQTFAQLDATAVYRIASETSGDYQGLRGYLWRSTDGRYHDDGGTLLPSETYNGATLYLSERLSIFGMVRDESSASVEDRADRATFLNSWSSLKNTKAAAAVLLPPGASRPEAHLGVNGAQLNSTTLGGRILMIATATVPKDTVVLITSVTYTDASGKKVTSKP